jgi:predicted hotdog family 3-hydroxylacyl-ACP dehydratase
MNDQLLKQDLVLPIDAELLVPHRRPVCMIDRLVEYRDESGVVEAFIRSENILVGEDGVLDRAAYMELIAQAFAAYKGYRDQLHEKPVKKGFLVVVKQMECKGEAFLGDLLKINVTTISEVGDFTIAEGTVTRNDEVIASGGLTLWIP